MQAIVFMVLFMTVMSTMFGLVGGTATGAIRLVDLQVQDVKAYFKNIENLMNDHVVMEQVLVPSQATMADYFDLDIIRQGANWRWGATHRDPWRNDFFIHVVYQDHPIRAAATTPVTVVAPRASGFILASRGPDGQFHPTLQAALNALTATSPINTLMNIEEVDGTDDIVHTFNTRVALEKRWQLVEWNLAQLASILRKRMKQMYASANFATDLQTHTDANYTGYYTGQNLDLVDCNVMTTAPVNIQDLFSGGTLVLPDDADLTNCEVLEEDTVLDGWKSDATLTNVPNVQQFLDVDDPETSSFMNFLANNPDPNLRLQVTAQPLKSDPGQVVFDKLNMRLSRPAGTTSNWAWKNGANQFYYQIETDE